MNLVFLMGLLSCFNSLRSKHGSLLPTWAAPQVVCFLQNKPVKFEEHFFARRQAPSVFFFARREAPSVFFARREAPSYFFREARSAECFFFARREAPSEKNSFFGAAGAENVFIPLNLARSRFRKHFFWRKLCFSPRENGQLVFGHCWGKWKHAFWKHFLSENGKNWVGRSTRN